MASRISLRPLFATRAGVELFVGREDELSRLVTNVEAGVNTLVLAERGGGLTSFLNRAAFEIEERGELRVVTLPGEVARSASDLLAAIADRLASVTASGDTSAPPPNRPEYASDDGAVLLWRVDRIAQLAARLETRVVVVVDGIASAAVAHTVFGQLRNEIWQLESITWVLGGSTARRERYLEPPADAFWEAVIELGPMPANALYAILATRKAADGTRDATNAVIAAADGNPMKLLVAAQSGADGPRPITRDDDVGISEAEARLIHYLQAHGSSSASDKRLLMELGWSRGRAQQVLKALEDAGLVTAQPAPSDGGPGRPRKVYQLVAP